MVKKKGEKKKSSSEEEDGDEEPKRKELRWRDEEEQFRGKSWRWRRRRRWTGEEMNRNKREWRGDGQDNRWGWRWRWRRRRLSEEVKKMRWRVKEEGLKMKNNLDENPVYAVKSFILITWRYENEPEVDFELTTLAQNVTFKADSSNYKFKISPVQIYNPNLRGINRLFILFCRLRLLKPGESGFRDVLRKEAISDYRDRICADVPVRGRRDGRTAAPPR